MTAPTDIEAEVRRAEALIGVGRFDDAATVLGRVVVTSPENARALCLLAQCYGGQNRYRQMLEAADRAVAVAPHSEWALRLRSTALRNLNQPRAALEAARQAVALGPFVWATHVTLTDVLLMSDMKEARREAYESAKRALEIAPDVPGTHNTMGRVLLSIGEHQLAQTYFERAIALDPTNSAAHTNLAITDLHKGRLSAASRRFGEVVANNPSVTSYVGNVNVAASAWIQRLLDYGWGVLTVEVIVGLALGLAYGPVIALGVVALGLVIAGLSYRRLTKPIRTLVLQKAREGGVLLAGLILAGLFVLITSSVIDAAVSGTDQLGIVGPTLVWWGVAAIVRFYGRIQQRTKWISRRRKYSKFVLGDERKSMIPAPRRPGD